jgi:hypothetical protein
VSLDVAHALDRYLTTFATRDPAAIADLHSPGSIFWLRLNERPAVGRPAVEQEFAALFSHYRDLTFEVRNTRLGATFWVLDWVLNFQVADRRIGFDCLDVVDLDRHGSVARKNTWIDLAQAQARAGTVTDSGNRRPRP